MSGVNSVPNIPSLQRTLSSGGVPAHLSRSQSAQSPNPAHQMNTLDRYSVVYGHNRSNTNDPNASQLRSGAPSPYNRSVGIHNNATAPSTAASTSAAAGRSAVGAQPNASVQDWRMYLTIEERQAVRSKIRDAYLSRCSSFEDILQAASAIEEELLHMSAPSRLDYFKSGFEFETRVRLKREQFKGIQEAEAKRWSSSGNENGDINGNGCSPRNHAEGSRSYGSAGASVGSHGEHRASGVTSDFYAHAESTHKKQRTCSGPTRLDSSCK